MEKLKAITFKRVINSLWIALKYLRYLYLFFILVMGLFIVLIMFMSHSCDLIIVKSVLLVFFGFDYEPHIIEIPYLINILIRFFGYLFLGSILQALIKAFEYTQEN